MRAVSVAHALLKLTFEAEELRLVMRVEEIEAGGFERVESGDRLALHLEARLALLAEFAERLLHFDVTLLFGEDGVCHLAHAVSPRGAREFVDAPRAVTKAELIELVALVHELRVNLHQRLGGGGDDPVHVPAPRQHLVPPRHRVPSVGRAKPPRLHHVLDQRAAVARVGMLRSLRVGQLHKNSGRLLQLHQHVEAVQHGNVRGGANLGKLPPSIEEQFHSLFPALLRLGDATGVERGVDADDVRLRRLLHLGSRRAGGGANLARRTNRSGATANATAARCDRRIARNRR